MFSKLMWQNQRLIERDTYYSWRNNFLKNAFRYCRVKAYGD